MRQALMVIAVIIGFAASFSMGVYTGAVLKKKPSSKSATSITDNQNAVSAESGKRKDQISASEDPTLQADSVEAPVNDAQSKTSEETEIALSPPPEWLRVTLSRARTDTSVVTELPALNPENKLSQDGKSATRGPKTDFPFNGKSYVIQTKYHISTRNLKKVTKIIQILEYNYSLVGKNSDVLSDYNSIRISGFTERLTANKVANILTSKTGQEFITLRISNLK